MTFLRDLPDMYYLLAVYLLLSSHHGAYSAEEAEHRDFQYNSVVDPETGRYNFAYDTGQDNEIAHTLHMQYRDANGIVRGRYGYTDPRGKLRMVEYEAGPGGFVARGDVGPDEFPHGQAPETQVSQIARYSQGEDLQLVPRPVQMAGWDPMNDPMGQPVTTSGVDDSNTGQNWYGTNADTGNGYLTTNNTSNGEVESYAPAVETYDERYPRMSVSTNENSRRELEDLTAPTAGDENKSEMLKEEFPVAGPVNVNNIDVNPNDIRVSTNQGPVRRSADGDRSRYTSATIPYSYRNLNYYRPPTHDHDAETRSQATGYRVVYRPNHDHYNERYYRRQTHDHDAERRYVSYRQTHDHDAERRRYLSNRQTHDHDAERRNYYRSAYYPNRRRIFYRDNHSMVPHEHYSDVYRNDNTHQHQHSDVQLYGRTQNLEYPATARPRQLKYIPADKYHDKYYYWTDS